MSRYLVLCVVTLVMLGQSAPVLAHHVVSESGIAWVEPISVMEAELSVASFDFGPERRGTWQKFNLGMQWAPHERVSLSVQVPWASVRFDDGRQAYGLGDVSLGTKVGVFSTPHGGLIISAGLGLELPTGEARAELGSGHLEWAPFLATSSQITDNFLTFALVSGRFAPGVEEASADAPTTSSASVHGSVLSPHASLEYFARVGGAWVWPEVAYLSSGLDVVWVPGGEGEPGVWRGEFGWLGWQGVRVALGGEVTLWGEARMGRMGRMSVAKFF